jgi:hypothetical protein
MQVGPITVMMTVTEASLEAGSEVSGVSAALYEVPENGHLVLLRQGSRVHGPIGARTDALGLDSEGSYRIWMQVMTDGTVAAASGARPRASGTAFGELELSRKGDPTGAPIPNGNCGFATAGHQWSLEPA